MGSTNPPSMAIRAAGFQMKSDQLDLIRSTGWTSVRGEVAEGKPINILDEGIGASVHFTHQLGIPGIAATQIVADPVHDLDRTAERKVSSELI